MPDYLTYSYWIEITSMDTWWNSTAPRRTNHGPENLTVFGEHGRTFRDPESDDHRIPGNVSTITISDETWLYGRITDLHLLSIPGARIEVQQPSHPDPEIAGRTLSGISGTDGSYEVSGLIPRYPATVRITADGYYEHEESIAINVSGRIHYPARLTPIPPPPLPEIGGTAVYPPGTTRRGVGIVWKTDDPLKSRMPRHSASTLAPDIQYSTLATRPGRGLRSTPTPSAVRRSISCS